MTEIIMDKLWLGSSQDSRDTTFITENKIDTIICCARELICLNPIPGITYYHFPIDDYDDSDISYYFREIHNIIDTNNRVLVHCYAGVNRSPTIVCSYLIYKLNISADQAIMYVKEIREEVDIIEEFKRALQL